MPSRYRSGDRGYDMSYPQCPTGDHPPQAARFAVIGINAGKSFTVNPCLSRQLRESAGLPRAVYVNSGYNPGNESKVDAGCRAVAHRLRATPTQEVAYGIGCQEGEHAVGAFRAAGAFSPLTWWIGVESSNSWDEVDLNLNRYALEGLMDRLSVEGPPVGVYSTFKEWFLITGAWRSPRTVANWVAGRPVADACSKPGFTGAPVWLAQALDTWPEGIDSNWAC